MTAKPDSRFFSQVAEMLLQAREQVARQVNSVMVLTYFEIGRMIVEEEQKGKERAGYGEELLKGLSEYLTAEFGRGYSMTNLHQMRTFYQVYSFPQTVSEESSDRPIAIPQTLSEELEIDESGKSQTVSGESFPILQTPSEESGDDGVSIQQTPSAESKNRIGQTVSDQLRKSETASRKFTLSWSHYLILMRIDDPDERGFYEIESAESNWSVRELKRQVDSALYQRLVLSRDREEVKRLAQEGQQLRTAKDVIKDPLVLEFLGFPEHSTFSESELEQGIIDRLEYFLMELGKGFTFVARQKRISFEERHFYIDLVFYNRILRCFVIIDLKIGDLTHQDIGQMQMYVNYYDRFMRLEDENRTIGIILSQHKSNALVEITLPEGNNQIFASKYKTVLPSKEDFIKLITNK
jgi:predicted nuclease of restriction endonuclease-like (RecB) superfamily